MVLLQVCDKSGKSYVIGCVENHGDAIKYFRKRFENKIGINLSLPGIPNFILDSAWLWSKDSPISSFDQLVIGTTEDITGKITFYMIPKGFHKSTPGYEYTNATIYIATELKPLSPEVLWKKNLW